MRIGGLLKHLWRDEMWISKCFTERGPGGSPHLLFKPWWCKIVSHRTRSKKHNTKRSATFQYSYVPPPYLMVCTLILQTFKVEPKTIFSYRDFAMLEALHVSQVLKPFLKAWTLSGRREPSEKYRKPFLKMWNNFSQVWNYLPNMWTQAVSVVGKPFSEDVGQWKPSLKCLKHILDAWNHFLKA